MGEKHADWGGVGVGFYTKTIFVTIILLYYYFNKKVVKNNKKKCYK